MPPAMQPPPRWRANFQLPWPRNISSLSMIMRRINTSALIIASEADSPYERTPVRSGSSVRLCRSGSAGSSGSAVIQHPSPACSHSRAKFMLFSQQASRWQQSKPRASPQPLRLAVHTGDGANAAPEWQARNLRWRSKKFVGGGPLEGCVREWQGCQVQGEATPSQQPSP